MNLPDYQGRQVRLTDERLAHILEHPEMIGLDFAIAETLRAPTAVIQSFSDQTAARTIVFISASAWAINGFAWWSNTAHWTHSC